MHLPVAFRPCEGRLQEHRSSTIRSAGSRFGQADEEQKCLRASRQQGACLVKTRGNYSA